MSTNVDARQFPSGERSRPGNRSTVVLRAAEPPRTSYSQTLIEISHRLRPRDYTMASLLDEHTTLTTDQLTSILFTNATTCRHRLHTLRKIAFVDRFIRNRPGAPNPICRGPTAPSATRSCRPSTWPCAPLSCSRCWRSSRSIAGRAS